MKVIDMINVANSAVVCFSNIEHYEFSYNCEYEMSEDDKFCFEAMKNWKVTSVESHESGTLIIRCKAPRNFKIGA